ncbi:MAG: esterase [Fibrobacter sp.]|nr:esterase [Fibrobacter sp.]MCQ2123174.1 esterase [Fibrobacter sp.]
MKNSVIRALPIALAATLCTSAYAYTVQGTVTNKADGKAVADASVSLLKNEKSTKTDASGKFSLEVDEKLGIAPQQRAGFINVNQGVLNYAQSGSPVQVKVFDMVGNLVSSKTLYGSGSYDLRQGISAKGTYFARVRVGSAMQSVKFNADGSASGFSGSSESASLGGESRALLKFSATDDLQVIADGYDTLTVALSKLDTTLALELTQAEKKYKFGYALKNAPTPSKGCGKESTLRTDKRVENGEHHVVNVNGTNREYFITLPKNYDNTKPYKIMFAMHCYGSSAEDFVHHTPDYDHPTPYYGQQVLDKNGDYIFVSAQAVGGLWNKGQDDHDFFGKMLTTMEENYCIDTSRVFVTGFSFGAMYSNSLAQDYQDRIRAVATYAVADYNIWLPQENGSNKKLPIAWMNVHGVNDGRCDYKRARDSALPRILKNNGKASDGDSQFTDASAEKPEEISGNTGHVCYDFKTVDPRFPVKWCSWPGDHQWTAHDTGNMGVGWNWESTWVPEAVHKFFEQF